MQALSFIERMHSFCDESLLYSSRIHSLSTFSQTSDQHVFTLREDESSFGISGCKRRKYASLLPWLSGQNIQKVALIGGANSNHIAGMLQLLNEQQLEVELFLKKSNQQKLRGNRWLIHLLYKEEDINWIPDMPWKEAEDWVRSQIGSDTYLIPEGGSCSPAFPGACTLLGEINRHEATIGKSFDHIFIDSGTGMMAASLSTAMQWTSHPARLHVILIAGSKTDFEKKLHEISKWWNDWMEERPPSIVLPELYYSVSAKSFGAVNKTVINETKRLAREEGLLTDPVYTSKLFLSSRSLIQEKALEGNILIIHSGGGTGLMGFGNGETIFPVLD